MMLNSRDQYQLAFDPTRCECRVEGQRVKFAGRAAKRGEKLYVVSVAERPVYVGRTRQSMAARLRGGFQADGRSGYHGYKWRQGGESAELSIWYPDGEISTLDLETIEGEVVFLIRLAGQWPESQNEIHFHKSDKRHREAAEAIVKHFDLSGLES